MNNTLSCLIWIIAISQRLMATLESREWILIGVSLLGSAHMKTRHCLFTTSDSPPPPNWTCSPRLLCSRLHGMKKQIMLVWPSYFPLPPPRWCVICDGMSFSRNVTLRGGGEGQRERGDEDSRQRRCQKKGF